MKSIDQFPGEDMALREKLPEFKPDTRDALIRWGETQPGALPWLLKRAARYWDMAPMAKRTVPDGALNCDATAALDLLRWRIEARTDKEAVGHLGEVQGPSCKVQVGQPETCNVSPAA